MVCVRSEGASPTYTRTSSSPSLNEIDSSALEMNHLPTSGVARCISMVAPSATDKQLSTESTDSSEAESCLLKDKALISGGGTNDDDEVVQFCVGDVRKRLSQHSTAPKRTYQRDPEDPSG